jgi:hypothetical protein
MMDGRGFFPSRSKSFLAALGSEILGRKTGRQKRKTDGQSRTPKPDTPPLLSVLRQK